MDLSLLCAYVQLALAPMCEGLSLGNDCYLGSSTRFRFGGVWLRLGTDALLRASDDCLPSHVLLGRVRPIVGESALFKSLIVARQLVARAFPLIGFAPMANDFVVVIACGLQPQLSGIPGQAL